MVREDQRVTRNTTLAVYREGAARVKGKIGRWLADEEDGMESGGDHRVRREHWGIMKREKQDRSRSDVSWRMGMRALWRVTCYAKSRPFRYVLATHVVWMC